MELKISTSYLEPINLGDCEWVDVTLPDGRRVTVFDDAIYVKTADDVSAHKDGKKVWDAGHPSRSPYGRVKVPGKSGGLPPAETGDDGMTAGTLQDALDFFFDRDGAWGTNMSPSKKVLLRVEEEYYPLGQASASFHEGSFVIVLAAKEDGSANEPEPGTWPSKAEWELAQRTETGDWDISEGEFEAAKADVIAKFGSIPASLQSVIDHGGRFGRAHGNG